MQSDTVMELDLRTKIVVLSVTGEWIRPFMPTF